MLEDKDKDNFEQYFKFVILINVSGEISPLTLILIVMSTEYILYILDDKTFFLIPSIFQHIFYNLNIQLWLSENNNTTIMKWE